MAAPVDAASVGTNSSTSQTTHSINMPPGIQAGDLLVVFMRSSVSNVTLDSGDLASWTRLVNGVSDGSGDKNWIIYKVASGSEGSTQSAVVSPSTKIAAVAWRVTGGGTPGVSGSATGTSNAPDPAATSLLTGDYLFIWAGGWEGEQTSPPTGNPANYSNVVAGDTGTAGGAAGNCRVAGATRQRTGMSSQSEDPGSWTISASDDWAAWTVYIPGVSTVDSQAEIAWAELEVPNLNSQAEVAWAELEVPTANSQAEVSWAELEVPALDAQAEVAWAELEVPLQDAQAEVAWAELEVPNADSQAEIAWAEFEVPIADAGAEVAQAEFEVPSSVSDAQGEIAWAEVEIPTADSQAEVSWAEFEVPFIRAQAEIAWVELEVPSFDGQAEIAFVEFEVPNANSWAEISWVELEVPIADSQAEIAHAQFEVPDVGGGGGVHRCSSNDPPAVLS